MHNTWIISRGNLSIGCLLLPLLEYSVLYVCVQSTLRGPRLHEGRGCGGTSATTAGRTLTNQLQHVSIFSSIFPCHATMYLHTVSLVLFSSFPFLPPPSPTRTVDTASLEYEAVPEALQPPLQLRLPQHMLGDKGLRVATSL